jgi:nucleoside-diphosphate-sugar epimerase
MRIFVVGGTGVVGRRAVPALVAQGHEVTVLVRSPARARLASALGARPVEASLFDPASLCAVVAGHEVVINLATSIPPFSKAARAGAWAQNDRIRTDGARNLVNAAIEASVGRYVQESVTFLYADNGSAWIHEGHRLRPNSITASAVRAEEQARRMLDRGNAVILRFGAFYGPDSGHTVSTLRLARMGLGSMPGPRDAFVSSVATDDAAAAVVAAAGTALPSGTYNVVDDEPITRERFDEVLAHTVGRNRLRPIPDLVVRLTGEKLDHVTRSHRVANEALRNTGTWSPRYRSVRDGLPVVAAALREGLPSPRVAGTQGGQGQHDGPSPRRG